jgi:hypothetical protein
MSLLSGSSNASSNKELFGYFAQSSIFGACIPVVYGTMRTTGNVINTFAWVPTPATSGGKFGGKGAGGKGAADFTYQTGFIEGISIGPIEGVPTIWMDRTVYKPSQVTESITIPGTGMYPAANPGFFMGTGVQKLVTFSHTVNDYGSPGSTTISGTQTVPLVEVPSSPGPGQYSVDSLGNYTFNAADYGIEVQLGYFYNALGGASDPPPIVQLKFTLFLGTPGQAAWTFQTTPPSITQLGYTQLAYIACEQFPLGNSGVLPNFSFEVVGKLVFPAAGVLDCDPTAIFADFLCNGAYGANFPSALLGSLTEASTYCLANGIFCSALYDSQRSAASWLAELLIIANAEAVWSDATLKLRSRGDTTAVGNGVIFTPGTQPIYELDDDDFIAKRGEEPVEFDLPTSQDAYNSLKVEWSNRGNGYQAEPIPAQDDYAIQLYGIREASQISLHGITESVVAAKTAQVQLKKLVYERGTAKFTLGMWYCLLEPMDMVTVTDVGLGFNQQPFRIDTIDEDDQGQLAIVATIFPWSISQPTLHPKQPTGGYIPPFYAQPGSVNAPIFYEAPQQLTQQIGLVIFILLSGGPNWGGCSVYESADGVSYDFVARHAARSTDGVLTASLPWSPDPDTSDTLAVDLVQSIGALESYSQAQADKFVSLALVGQELVAYTTATLGAGYNYNLTGYLRRGLFGTTTTEHASGARFAALDGTEFQDSYQKTDIGKTRWYKFTSFNLAGQLEEDISTVTAYPWSIQAPYTRGPLALKPFTGEYGFGPTGNSPHIDQVNGGNTLAISATPPVNTFSQVVIAPVIDSNATVTPTGGNLPHGTYIGQAFAIDSAGAYGPGSNFIEFTTTNTTSQITFNITLPAGSTGYELFFGTDMDRLLGLGAQTGTPSSITVALLSSIFYGPPDGRAVAWHARGKRVIHAGIAAATVVSSTLSTVVIGIPAAAALNEFAGRFLILASKYGLPSTQPYAVIPIIGNDTGFPNCTLSVLSPQGFFVGAGDLVLIATKSTGATATSITDTGWASPFGPGGLDPHASAGNILRVLFDPTGSATSGDSVVVLDNTTTSHTTTPWPDTPGNGTVFIEEERAWREDVITTESPNAIAPVATPAPVPLATISASDLAGYVALVELLAQDADGNDSPEFGDGFRMIYVLPQVADSSDGEYHIPITTVTRSLAAAITSTSATTATLDASTGLPAAPFLITFGAECCLVTANTGASITTMQRGYNGTTKATHLISASAIVMLAQPSVGSGLMQQLAATGNVTLQLPVDLTVVTSWTLDVVQDATGGWAVLPTTGYTGTGAGGNGDPLKWDSSPSMRYYVDFATRSAGTVAVTGGRGPFTLT